MARPKIAAEYFDTPGYDGDITKEDDDENIAPDTVNDEIDEYLAHSSDDDDTLDMYASQKLGVTPQ